jgi:hypothetical protein
MNYLILDGYLLQIRRAFFELLDFLFKLGMPNLILLRETETFSGWTGSFLNTLVFYYD